MYLIVCNKQFLRLHYMLFILCLKKAIFLCIYCSRKVTVFFKILAILFLSPRGGEEDAPLQSSDDDDASQEIPYRHQQQQRPDFWRKEGDGSPRSLNESFRLIS